MDKKQQFSLCAGSAHSVTPCSARPRIASSWHASSSRTRWRCCSGDGLRSTSSSGTSRQARPTACPRRVGLRVRWSHATAWTRTSATLPTSRRNRTCSEWCRQGCSRASSVRRV